MNTTLLPPPIKLGPSRPRKNRKKSAHEDPKKPGKLTRHGLQMSCRVYVVYRDITKGNVLIKTQLGNPHPHQREEGVDLKRLLLLLQHNPQSLMKSLLNPVN